MPIPAEIPLAQDVMPAGLSTSVYPRYARARKAALTARRLYLDCATKPSDYRIDRAALEADVKPPQSPETYQLVRDLTDLLNSSRTTETDSIVCTAVELYALHACSITPSDIDDLTSKEIHRATQQARAPRLRRSASLDQVRSMLHAFTNVLNPPPAPAAPPATDNARVVELLHSLVDELAK